MSRSKVWSGCCFHGQRGWNILCSHNKGLICDILVQVCDDWLQYQCKKSTGSKVIQPAALLAKEISKPPDVTYAINQLVGTHYHPHTLSPLSLLPSSESNLHTTKFFLFPYFKPKPDLDPSYWNRTGTCTVGSVSFLGACICSLQKKTLSVSGSLD